MSREPGALHRHLQRLDELAAHVAALDERGPCRQAPARPGQMQADLVLDQPDLQDALQQLARGYDSREVPRAGRPGPRGTKERTTPPA
ncbi:hypothetical protein [Streptacidiphilus sp. PAMC 29251]